VRLAIAGSVSLLVALVVWSLGDGSVEEADRREQIAMKSESDRELLRRRYDAFQKLPAEEREAIRNLHEATVQDAALASTLSRYESFVARLDPWDQQELREIRDPDERVAEVRKLTADRSPPDRPGRPSWLSGRSSERFTFGQREFDQAMVLVADLLDLSQQERDQLEELERPERHLRIAKQAAERFHKQPRWPDQADYEQIVNLLPEDGFRSMLLRDQTPAEFSRRMLAYTLMKSLFVEWQAQIPLKVSHDEIRQALDDMPAQEQSEFSRRDPDQLMTAVMKQLSVSDDQIGRFAKNFVEVAQLRSEFDPFRMGRRGFGPRPDGDGGRGRPGFGPGNGGPPPPPPGFGGDRRFGDDRGGSSGRPEGPRGPGGSRDLRESDGDGGPPPRDPLPQRD
jgi:hypothetical protein